MKQNTVPQNFAGRESLGEARDIAAKAVDLNRETYRQGKVILDNQNLLSVEDFANWDEGKLSTNKAYQLVKARLKELEAENEELKSREPEVVEVEVAVTPPDADDAYTVEVSENTKRKDFTMEELLEIAEHKYQEGKVKGKQNMSAGGRGEGLVNLPNLNANTEAAAEIGVSSSQYQHMRHIRDQKETFLSSPDNILYKGQEYSPAEFYEMSGVGDPGLASNQGRAPN